MEIRCRSFRRILALILCLVTVLAYTPAWVIASAEDEELLTDGDWTYEEVDGAAAVMGYTGSETSLTIPEEMGGLPVTTLRGGYNGIFYGNNTVTELTIPYSVKYVDAYSLRGGVLRTIRFDCDLAEVDERELLPSGVRKVILGAAFEILPFYEYFNNWLDNEELQAYEVDDDNLFYTAVDGVLYNKEMTTLYRFPESKNQRSFTVPDTVTEIYAGAFKGAKYLTELHIPETVTEFGTEALGDKDGWDPIGFAVYGKPGSEAESFAMDYDVTFIYEEEDDVNTDKESSTRTVRSGEETSYWNGKETSPITPVGKQYMVSSAAELRWVGEQVAQGVSFSGCTVILTSDIDLQNKEWTPIGDDDYPFRGSFDGQGHTISNLKLMDDQTYSGLFGRIRPLRFQSITLKNVKLKNVTKKELNGSRTGPFAGDIDCSRGAKIKVSGITSSNSYLKCGTVGGIIGSIWCGHSGSEVIVEKCKCTGGDFYIKGGNGGGIIGYIDTGRPYDEEGFNGTITVKDCKFRGDMGNSGSRYATCGGIVGSLNNARESCPMLIEHCRVDGVVAAGPSSFGGGIISNLPNGHVLKSCVNYSDVSGYSSGGITSGNGGTIEECYNEGYASAEIGASNGGIAASNDGIIYNSYNAGSAPTTSALAYNGAIAANGSGTIENTYNIGAVDKEVSSSVAVSHPGVFGYSSGQILIHSYFDNTSEPYIFGYDVKESTVITDPEHKITESGGMSTAMMKDSANYTNWDFGSVWEFDLNYSWGYPTLSSIKDLLDKHPDKETINKMKKTDFLFTVVDQESSPVKDAEITLAAGTSLEENLVTGKRGTAKTGWRSQKTSIKVEKEGYVTYEDPSFVMNKKNEMTIMLIDKSLIDKYPLKSAIMEQDVTAIGSGTNHLRYELLTQSKTINRQWSNKAPIIPGTTYAPFTIKASLADPQRNYVRAELVQGDGDGKLIATASDPKNPVFSNLDYDLFDVTKVGTYSYKYDDMFVVSDIKIRLVEEKNGKEVKSEQKINLTVEDVASSDFEIEYSDSLSVTIPSSVPIVGGTKMEIPMAECPVSLKLNSDSLEVGFNLLEDGYTAGKGFLHDRSAKQISEDKYKNSLPGSIKQLLKYMKNPSLTKKENGMGPVKVSWKVVGYGKTDLPFDKKIEGRLFVELTVSIGGETQVYCFVVALDGKASVNGEGVLALDFNHAKIIDQSKSNISVGTSFGVGIFAGVGLANAVAVGVYGKPSLSVKWIVFGGDHQGLDDMKLSGQVSAALRLLGSNAVEYPLVSGEYTIYNWSEANDPSSQGKRLKSASTTLLKAMQDAPEQKIVVSDEAAASEWAGDSDTLQESAYSSSTPVIMSAGGDRVMLFCSNTDTDRKPVDRSMLMYSVYDEDSEAWGEPEPVNDDGTADFNPSASGKYLVWSNAKSSLDGCETYNDLGKKMEVCAAEYNSSSKSFTNVKTLTNNDVYENRISVTGESDPLVTWTVDEDDNILGVGGTNTFYTAAKSGSSWTVTEHASADDIVISYASGKLGGSKCIFYVVDEDGNLSTSDDARMYADDGSGPKLVTDEAVTQVCYADKAGKMIFTNAEGDIFSMTSADGEPVRETDDGRLGGESFVQAISDTAGNITIVLSKLDENGRNAYVIKYDKASSSWGGAVAITDQSDYVEGVSAYYEGDELVYAYNQRRVTLPTEDSEYSESNSLRWSKTSTAAANLVIGDVFYDRDDVAKGQDLPLTICIGNTGHKSLSQVGVKITSGSGSKAVTHTNVIKAAALNAGSNTDIEVALPVPANAEKTEYTVAVYDPAGEDSASTATITVGEPNYVIDREVYSVGGHDLITANVTNTGFASGRGTLEFYNEYEPDVVFDTYSFSGLEPDEVFHYTFRPEEKDLKYRSIRIGMRIVNSVGTVISDSRQAQIWRNAELPVTGVMLNKNYAEIDKVGGTVQLNAAAMPVSAASGAKFKWESSDPSVVSVDQKGLMTAVKAGKATVTVFSEDEKFYDECLVYAGHPDISQCAINGLRTRYAAEYDYDVECTPPFKVMCGKEELVPGVDYTYEYKDNKAIGDAHLIITGIGNCTGSVDKTFKIKPSYLFDKPDVEGFKIKNKEIVITLDEDEYAYIDGEITPVDAGDEMVIWTSSDENIARVSGESSDVFVEGVGEGVCTIEGKTRDGGFADSVKVTVRKSNGSGSQVNPPYDDDDDYYYDDDDDYYYDGQSNTSYQDAEAAAEAAFRGVKDSSIPKVKKVKAKAGKKSIKVSWKKATSKERKKFKKYEIQYSLKKSFPRKSTKIKTVSSKKKSVTLKKLKSKKKYYVRVRAIKTVKGVKRVGKWSSVKKVKVK